MKQVRFFEGMMSMPHTELSEVSTTARDLSAMLVSFREPLDERARRTVDRSWPCIVTDLERLEPDSDVVVLVSDSYAVLPRESAARIVRRFDPRLGDALSNAPSARPTFDVVVDVGGVLSLIQIAHPEARAPMPKLDWTRTFALHHVARGREVRYVFLDTGEAVLTWDMLAALLGVGEAELDARVSTTALSWTIEARDGASSILCVRIDLVEPFLDEVSRLAR